jgi:hypothetical protein
MGNVGNDVVHIWSVTVNVRNSSVDVRNTMTRVRRGWTMFTTSSFWEWIVNASHIEVTERTLKACRILSRSDLQVAIAFLSSFV